MLYLEKVRFHSRDWQLKQGFFSMGMDVDIHAENDGATSDWLDGQ